jgi:hypothetical protein
VLAAKRFIVDNLIYDFPFVGKNSGVPLAKCGDRAAALALMFLPFVRKMIPGPTPLHHFGAPTERTGKSMLVRALLWPGYGAGQETIAAPSKSDEMEKTVGSALVEGRPVILLDNVNHKLFSGTFASYITNYPDSTVRVLGHTATKIAPAPVAWITTANNLAASGEIAKRIVPCVIDAQEENPEQTRKGSYKHELLLKWAEEHRGELIAAICTIVRAWVRKGCPKGSAALGGFEEWVGVMSGLLESIGVNGLLTNRAAFLDNANVEAEDWGVLIRAWSEQPQWAGEYVPTKSIAALIEAEGIEDVLGMAGLKSISMSLGRRLSQKENSIMFGFQLKKGKDSKGHPAWRLVKIGETEPRKFRRPRIRS